MFAEQIQQIIRNVADGRRENIAEASKPFFIYAPFEAVHGASSCYKEGQPPNCEKPDGDELQVSVLWI